MPKDQKSFEKILDDVAQNRTGQTLIIDSRLDIDDSE